MRVDSVCILGGTGFVGRHIANRLANTPVAIKVLTEHRERNRHLLPIPNLQLVEANVHNEEDLRREFAGCDAVINLVGVLNDSSADGRGFEAAHVELPRKVISACRQTGVSRLLHMSALGAEFNAASRYQQTKAEGERLALEANSEKLRTAAFRPSVVFGPEDSFLNTFAAMLKIAPIMPLPTPQARFKPVYVGDVARAFIEMLHRREGFGESYELCGPKVYTLKELVEYCAELMGLKRKIIGLNDRFSRLQAKVLEKVPGKPYTYDNYLSTQVDNICTQDGLAALGIHPTALDAAAPAYLGQVKIRQRYNQYRRAARR